MTHTDGYTRHIVIRDGQPCIYARRVERDDREESRVRTSSADLVALADLIARTEAA